MTAAIKLFDVVALKQPVPDRGLVEGEVGTVVEALSENVFEVEFSDDSGRSYAMAALSGDLLLPLVERRSTPEGPIGANRP